MADRPCDIVLEGGGVKGIGLVGALEELQTAGYQHCRVAGTSAGAIVGSLLAAGMRASEMANLLKNVDYTKFRDEGLLDKAGVPGKTLSLIFEKGVYRGDYLYAWLEKQLAALGVHTFADLRLTEPWAKQLPEGQRYKLTVIASDITKGELVRLPWDYQAVYGLDPDKQSVAAAVRASMSIPFFYHPAKLGGNYLVDGGLLSNFPIDIFDTTDTWPTFGVKLSAKANAFDKINPVHNIVDYTLAILSTAMSGHDRMHIDDPCAQMRTIFVDTFDISATQFDISKKQQLMLYESGQHYAKKFLKEWSFTHYQKVCTKKQR